MSPSPPVVPLLVAIPRSELGGAQRSLLLLLRALDRDAFPPFVLLRETGPLVASLDTLGVRYEVAPHSWKSLRGVRHFDRVARREGSRVLYLYGPRTLALAARARGLAVVERVNLHRGPTQGGLVQFAFLDRTLLRLAHLVLVQTEILRAELALRGVPAEKIRLVPNGVWLEPPSAGREAIRRSLGVGAGAALVLSVGRLVGIKGFADLIDAVAQLRERARDVRLVIAGEGPERAALEERVRARGLGDSVRLLGDQEDVAGLVEASDLYVQTSHTEVLSNALLEAMSAGRAVVATDVGGTREVVEPGVTGLLVPPASPDALARAIGTLLEPGEAASARRATLGAAGRSRIQRDRSLEVMARATESVFREALALAGGGP